MGIKFENEAEDKLVAELTIGDLCRLVEYVIDRTHHNQMALTDAVRSAACLLERLTAKRTRICKSPKCIATALEAKTA